MSMSLKVEGLRELERALAELPRANSRSVSQRAMRAQLKPVAAMANAFWPGSADDVFRVGTRLARGQQRGGGRAGPSEIRMYVGAPGGRFGTPEAHLIEFGTGPRFQKNGRYTGQVAPTPMLQPAWDANKSGVLSGLAAELRTQLEQHMKRQARKAAR